MLRKEISFKQEVIGKLTKGKIDKKEARKFLECSSKTIGQYLNKGLRGLRGTTKRDCPEKD